MKYTPEKYEWERGDIIAALDYDAVWVKTNNGWGSTNGSVMSDESATRLVKSGNAKFVGNRKELL